MTDQYDKITSIVIDRLLKDIEETGQMPWQRPYEFTYAINHITKHQYRGVNRFILPAGEYITVRQLEKLGKQKGLIYEPTSGKTPWPVIFSTKSTEKITKEEFISRYGSLEARGENAGYKSWKQSGDFMVGTAWIKRYYDVYNVEDIQANDGSKIIPLMKQGKIALTFEKPLDVFNRYIESQGLRVQETSEVPSYAPARDVISLNPNHLSEESYWSTVFHELAHSTGISSRLARKTMVESETNNKPPTKEARAIEECVAELAASIVCSETNVTIFDRSNWEYDNQVRYVAHWSKLIKEFGKNIHWIVGQAEAAAKFILTAGVGAEES